MRIDPDSVPATVEQAVDALIASFCAEEVRVLRTMDHADVRLHFGPGRAIRNAWSLWEDTPLKRDAVRRFGIAHGDDISGLIFTWALAKIRKQPFDPESHCQRYKDHWASQGMDALQAGGWPPKASDTDAVESSD